MMLRVAVTLSLLLVITACDSDVGAPDASLDATTGTDAGLAEDAASVIRACAQLDDSGLVDEDAAVAFIARWEDTPCTAPLEGGDPGSAWACQFGSSLLVCGASAGLTQVGCNCTDGALECANGYEVMRGQERASCGPDAGV